MLQNVGKQKKKKHFVKNKEKIKKIIYIEMREVVGLLDDMMLRVFTECVYINKINGCC